MMKETLSKHGDKSSQGDIFDEFQFKPLSEGLGFHGNRTSTPVQKNKALTRPMAEEAKGDGFIEPAKSTRALDDVLSDLKKRQLDFATADMKKTPIHEYRASSIDLSAVFLDGLLVSALFLTCLILFLFATRIDLVTNLKNPDTEGMIYLSLGATILSLGWIYLVVTRVFAGKTAGEWVFDQSLGLPEEQKTQAYLLKVLVRSTLITATGFITIPLINEFFQKDILEGLFRTTHYRRI